MIRLSGIRADTHCEPAFTVEILNERILYESEKAGKLCRQELLVVCRNLKKNWSETATQHAVQ